jgi:phosphoglycerate kinase
MTTIDNYKFAGKKVLIRVDFNVPLDKNQNITDDTRIVTAIPTIRKILTDGGSAIIMTHIGRPKGKHIPEMSVKHIVEHVSMLLDANVRFVNQYEEDAKAISQKLLPGEVMMLENLRFTPAETKGDTEFAKQLAELGDAYVMDAFGTAHREHASTAVIAKFFPYDKMFGYLVEDEIKNIDKVLKKSAAPFTAIIGGSKVSTKIMIIEALLEKVDHLIIGGGIGFTFAKAMGGKIGNSLVENDFLDVAKKVIEKAKTLGVELHLPTDTVIANEFSNDAKVDHSDIMNIKEGWMGLDVGIRSANRFAEVIENSKTILWNGPIGVFEMSKFSTGTLRVALAVARATDKGAYSLIGGGDSIAAVNQYGLAPNISYISTAGGALLEYIEGKQLPSIKAIKTSYSLDDYEFKGKRALIRVDMNVPLDKNHRITDKTRIVTALPTIHKIIADGGSVIIMTHIGRPKGQRRPEMSVKHIIPTLNQLLGTEVKFSDLCVGDEAEKMAKSLKPGEVMILENLRFTDREVGGDIEFAEALSKLGDVYVMDAFGTAHRAHASTATIAQFFPEDKMLGYLVEKEINQINRAIYKAKKPYTAVIGGSKISTKIGIINSLVDKVDNLIIAGGIAYTFAKAQGGKIGNSLVENDYLDVALEIIEKAKQQNVNIYLPNDTVIADSFSNDAQIEHCNINEIPDGWMGLDIGIKTADQFSDVILNSKTIIWNGPIGVFEMSNFSLGTLKIAMAIARATANGAYSLIGGGDSIAAVNKYSLDRKVSYISTAGGALLEYLEGKVLPSIKAVKGDLGEL